jgi:hypothetical protein
LVRTGLRNVGREAGTGRIEEGGSEVGELFMVGEFKRVGGSDTASNGFVEGDDSIVDTDIVGGEEPNDIGTVVAELVESVRESIRDCRGRNPPCDGPIADRRDRFFRKGSPILELNVSEGFDSTIRERDGVESPEDDVKIDSPACQDVGPFGIRELGAID